MPSVQAMSPTKALNQGKQSAKLTWREIRERIEAAGVQDGDEIDCIEISWGTLDQVTFTKDQDFGWQIRQNC